MEIHSVDQKTSGEIVMEWMGGNAKAISILRVSSFRQKDNTSHGVQRLGIKEYCDSQNLRIEREVEIVESAKDSDQRKDYHAAIEWALQNGIRHLVFYMFDREARNLTDNEDNEKLVKRDRIVLHYVREGKVLHKNSADSDFMMRDFHAIQNKQYSRNLSAKVGDSMRRKAEDGWYPSNKPPLGYLPVATLSEDGRGRRRSKIVGLDPNPKVRQQVLREFELRAEGNSFEEIRRKIIEEGFIRKDRVRNYHATVVESRLKNLFYRGRFSWGGKEYQGRHELFVPKSLIDQVDLTLFKRGFKTKPITQENALAGGWITCGTPECGCSVVFEKKRKVYRNGSVQEFRYYHCTNGRSIHRSLKGMNIREEQVWEQLESSLDVISLDEGLAGEIAEALNEAQRRTKNTSKVEAKDLHGKIESTRSEEDELYVDFKKGVITEEMYLRIASKVRERRMELTKQLENAQLSNSDVGVETAKTILELSTSAKSLWKLRTPLERVALLKKLLSNPTLDGTTLRYEIKKPFRILSEMAETLEWRTRVEEFRTACTKEFE